MSTQSTAKALPGITDRNKYRPVHRTEKHKGCYCDNNNYANLKEIDFDGHLAQIDDDEEHLTSAGCLHEGSCQAFAMQDEEIFGYEAFIIEEHNERVTMHFAKLPWKAKLRQLMPEE